MRTTIGILLAGTLTCAHAQWLNYPDPSIPRTADGKPDLSAPAPHTPDGKPDLSGIWGPGLFLPAIPPGTVIDSSLGPEFSLQFYRKDAAPIPMTAWAASIFKDRNQTFGRDRPSGHCLPHGIPDAMLPSNFKIVQNPGLTFILYEEFARFRQIFTDGRSHPKEMNPAWLGYSIGKWDSDTFVVDTVGFNDRSWLDDAGHPHSDQLHTIERFRRPDFGRLEVEVMIEDPKAYTEPWSLTLHFGLLADTELIEDVCDNEKDFGHSIGRGTSDDNKANVDLAPQILSEYAGTYEGEGFTVDVVLVGSRLVILGEELMALSESKFSGSRGITEFVKDRQGRVTHMIVAPATGGEFQMIRKPAPSAGEKR